MNKKLNNRNPRKLTDTITDAIQKRCGTAKRYYIGVLNDEIVCWPVGGKYEQLYYVFGTFSESDLSDGLTMRQWGRLFDKIGAWLEKK